MQTYEQIQFQVGAWSLGQFGGQYTTRLPVFARVDGETAWYSVKGVVVALGSTASLLALVRSVGVVAGVGKDNGPDLRGRYAQVCAVGDVAISLCDYCCREGILFPPRVEMLPHEQYEPLAGLSIYLGRLCAEHLERHLCVTRGLRSARHFAAARASALRGFTWHLGAYATHYTKEDLLIIMNAAWDRIISGGETS